MDGEIGQLDPFWANPFFACEKWVESGWLANKNRAKNCNVSRHKVSSRA